MAGRVHLAVSGRGKWFPQCASDGLVAALKLFAIHHCALLLCLQNVFAPWMQNVLFPSKTVGCATYTSSFSVYHTLIHILFIMN